MTEVVVKAGQETAWDRVYHERAADARRQPGWVDLHLLVPEDDPHRRVVVGTWESREAWERWHQTEIFQRTKQQLDAASEQHGDERWFRVVEQHTG